MPNWLKLVVAGLGAAGAVAAVIASGGSLAPAIVAGVSSATGSLATLFADRPGTVAAKQQ